MGFGKAMGEMFGALFPVVNPIAVVPVFLAMTANRPVAERMKVALKSSVYVFVILVVFLFAGEPLLHHFGISLEALQIAGGLVVGIAGLRMVLEPVKVTGEDAEGDVSFSPLAMPLLAGPGALGVLMGLEARRTSDIPSPGFVVGIVLIAIAVYACLVLGGQLVRFIGDAGIDALRRIFGLLVMAIGVEMIVHGINEHEALRSAFG
ncbi:MAG: MarC family protein [Actinobacteria bacterium]|nr:MarC family protein [Actinomycetota bacterium]